MHPPWLLRLPVLPPLWGWRLPDDRPLLSRDGGPGEERGLVLLLLLVRPGGGSKVQNYRCLAKKKVATTIAMK